MASLNTRIFRKILVALGVWLFAVAAWSQTLAPSLFSSSFISPSVALKHEPEVVRVRQVFADVSLLTARLGEIGKLPVTPQELTLNLFDDVQLVADLDRVEPALNGMAWVGRLRGVDFSKVIFVVSGNIVAGHIISPAGRYQILPVSDGVHEIQAIGTTLVPSTQGTALTSLLSQAPAMAGDVPPSISADPDNGATIDVMVVYTAAAASGAGGEGNLQAQINLAIAETNDSIKSSDSNNPQQQLIALRLVRTQQITYTETSPVISTALTDITSNTTVQALRTQYGADIVSLWVEGEGSDSSDECGSAWGIFDTAHAFNVVKRSCARGPTYYGFAHQFGHTMGAGHDVASGGAGVFAYSHGYCLTAQNVRSIMAMGSGCPTTNRYPIWSNISQTYGGLPWGNATTADNYRTLKERALVVAAFVTSVPVSLTKAVPLAGLYGAVGSETIYKLTLPQGIDINNLAISLSGGSGDADLYVKFGSVPTTTTYDCRSQNYLNADSCTTVTRSAGDWYIMIKGFTEYSGVTLLADYTSPVVLKKKEPRSNLSGALGSEVIYKMTVPSGAKNLVVTTSGGSGNVDLYLKHGTVPTTASNDCLSVTSTNAESCHIAAPAAGEMYVMLKGGADYSGVTLLGEYRHSTIVPILMLLLD